MGYYLMPHKSLIARRKYGREYARNHPDIGRKQNYIRKFGITLSDYNHLFELQDGKCKICFTHQSQLRIRMAVDHCHKTKLIRGLLCQGCNAKLGIFEDESWIMKANNYLKGLI
jgi:Recombination endonuclease VII